jgi:hypothetical protein
MLHVDDHILLHIRLYNYYESSFIMRLKKEEDRFIINTKWNKSQFRKLVSQSDHSSTESRKHEAIVPFRDILDTIFPFREIS